MKHKITLREIADHFKVSIGTVSKALRGSHEISEATKRKIGAYAKKHRYVPNINAINLRKEHTATIGLIIPNILNYFFAQVFSGIEMVANEKGYNLISCISNESLSKEIATATMLRNGLISGLLVSLSEETEKFKNTTHFKGFLDLGIPIVMFDRVSDAIPCDKVIVDDFKAAYNATEYLIKSGCHHIAVVSILDHLQIGKQRIAGYRKCMDDYGLPWDKKLIVKNFDKALFTAEVSALLHNHKVDAILGLEEFAAVNSMSIAKKIGFQIPNDISIIGFTNGMLPQYVTPTISSVSQHGKHIGAKAAQMLIERIEEDYDTTVSYRTEVVKTSLVVRESTKNEEALHERN